jgi:hypothetical protein
MPGYVLSSSTECTVVVYRKGSEVSISAATIIAALFLNYLE